MTLGEEMTRFHAKYKLTQKEFAYIVGVTVQTICNVETGQQTPSRVTEQKIRMAMEVNGDGED